MNIRPLLLLSFVFLFSFSHFTQCPPHLSPRDLVIVGVWKSANSISYPISDEDLSVNNHSLLKEGSRTALLPQSLAIGECPIGLCLLRFHLNIKDDGSTGYEEDLFGGENSIIHSPQSILCAKEEGDCGADNPIYVHSAIINGSKVRAYSLNGETRIEGFHRESMPLCYAWSSRSSVMNNDANSTNHCIEMKSVENGKMVYSSSSYDGLHSIGTSVSLSCSPPSLSSGHSHAVCTRSGWYPSPFLGPCTIPTVSSLPPSIRDECSMMKETLNGKLIYSSLPSTRPFPAGTTVSLLCDIGFAPAGESTATCNGSTWTANLSECYPISTFHCLPPLPIPNGKFSYFFPSRSPFSHGSIVTLVCLGGFSMEGREKISCTDEGWTGSLGACIQNAVQCPLLSSVAGGKITYTLPLTPTSQGSSAVLECLDGSTAHPSVSTCLGGQWTNSLGSCGSTSSGLNGVSCLSLPSIVNGRISYSLGDINGSFPPGTTATPSCSNGYGIYGSRVATCLPTGKWTRTRIGNCGPAISNGCLELNGRNVVMKYSLSSVREGFRPQNTIGTLTCSQGKTTGNVVSTCVGDTWSPPFGECTLDNRECSSLPTPIGGSLQYSNGMVGVSFPSGVIVKLSCGDGRVEGSAMAECVQGNWRSNEGESIGKCSELGGSSIPPSSSSITHSGVLNDPQPLNEDGDLIGSSDRVDHRSNATSSSCLAPLPPLGSSLSYSIPPNIGVSTSGTIVSLNCPGSIPVGPPQARCSNGLWTPTLGRCAQMGEPGYSGGMSPSGGGSFSTLPPTGAINGQIGDGVNSLQGTMGGCTLSPTGSSRIGPFPSGTTLTLQCPLGSSITGSLATTCINGQWSQMGRCSVAGVTACNPAPMVLNGQIQYSSVYPYPIGSYARIHCNPGYSLYGESTTTCINGIWSPQSFGQCVMGGANGGGGVILPQSTLTTTQPWTTLPPQTGRICLVSPLTPLQGSLKYSSGNSVGPWNEGVIVALICSNGYHVNGAGASSCRGGSFLPPQLGVCTSSIGASRLPCSSPLLPLNGQFNFSSASLPTGGYPDGAMVALFCFQSSIPYISTCSNGGWYPLIPTSCMGLQRDSPSSAFSIQSSPTPSPISLSPPSPSSLSLSPPSPSSLCSSLRAPPYGEITFSLPSQPETPNRYPSSTRAFLVCTGGSSLEGNGESTCSNGVFTPLLGLCI